MATKRSGRQVVSKATATVSVERIGQSIVVIRGQKVLLDSDLAALYGVETKVLLQAVKRNLTRFPADFMLQLTVEEWGSLRSQFVTSSFEHGGRRYLPYAFTEQGVAMLSSVLKSERAVAMNIEIMRAFVRIRELLGGNKDLAHQLKTLEDRVARKFAAHDHAIADIIKTIRELINSPIKKSRPIGFTANLDEK